MVGVELSASNASVGLGGGEGEGVVIQMVDASGNMSESDQAWAELEATGASNTDPLVLVCVLGPQATGKSTLANRLFDTAFQVAPRTAVAAATTRGISAARSGSSTNTLILDVEGADARERGKQGSAFQARCAAFVANIADVIILNMWFHDTCRVDSAAYDILRKVLLTCARVAVDGSEAKTALVFSIRDVEADTDSEALEALIRHDAAEIWADVSIEAGMQAAGTKLEDVIDFCVVMFPHIRHQSDEFDTRVAALRESWSNGKIIRPAHSKNIPADGFWTYAKSVWDSVALSTSARAPGGGGETTYGADQYYGGEDFEIVAAYRCDEVFSQRLAEASRDIADLLDEVNAGNKITGLGARSHAIITSQLEQYDAETANYCDEPVCDRKRHELEVIMDTALMSVYMKNVSICAREALASFKSSIASEVPADYALFSADTQFVGAAKDGIRPGGSWSYEVERTDLQNMMKEIASQQQKLLDTQVTASVQQSKAIQFLRMQHAQMQAVQQQALGGGVGQWNVGAAYRPPDSNVNVSLGYQQGRTNLQVSMVPDESTSLLGPTGFTSGVGPGNLGLSFNVNF